MTRNLKWPYIIFSLSAVTLLYILSTLGFVLKPFLLALLGAYILKHPVLVFMRCGLPRSIASLLVIISVCALLAFCMFMIIPSLHGRITILILKLPALVETLIESIKPALELVQNYVRLDSFETAKNQIATHSTSIMQWIFSAMLDILGSTKLIANILITLVLTPILMFYTLQDWPAMVAGIKSWLPLKNKKLIINEIEKMDHAVIAYAKGQSLVCLCLALLYSVGLWIIDLKGSILLGCTIGILSFIPYVGAIFGFLISLIFALSQTKGVTLYHIVIVFALIQAIEGYALTPRLVGGKIGIPPVMVIFVLLAGAAWFGFVGVLLALPSAAIIKVSIDTFRKWLKDKKTI